MKSAIIQVDKGVFMTFKEWFFGGNSAINPEFSNPRVEMQWKLPHILVLLSCIALIVGIAFLFRKKNEKARKIVLWVMVGIILLFEITRRVKNVIAMCITDSVTFNKLLHDLLPRPWCAISCWSLIIAAIFKKKCLYNISSIMALLCAVIFFAYPGAGFNNVYIYEFENLYSIITHSMLLVTSISLITLKFADFKYKNMWKELICLAVIYIYACLEIWVLKIEGDPLYFMPGGDIQDILGVGNAVYVIIYIIFLTFFVNMFYLIGDRKRVFRKRK